MPGLRTNGPGSPVSFRLESTISLEDLCCSGGHKRLAISAWAELQRNIGHQRSASILARLLNVWFVAMQNDPDIRADEMIITSGYRPLGEGKLNDAVKGERDSDHGYGAAADVSFFRGGRQVGLHESAVKARCLRAASTVPEGRGFNRVILYNGVSKNNFVHVSIDRPGARSGGGQIEWGTKSRARPEICTRTYACALNGTGVTRTLSEGNYLNTDEYDEALNEAYIETVDADDVEDVEDIDLVDVVRALGVKADHEGTPLVGLPPPGPGEIDIGDLRFGSADVAPVRPEHLTQPTSLHQSQSSAVGTVDLLRTDTSPVLGDGRFAPEVLVTLRVNTTTRDDIDRVLRPLVAMLTRHPFVPVRNAELAQLMLGRDASALQRDALRLRNPTLTNEELEDKIAATGDILARDAWIPCTARWSVDTDPNAPGVYDVSLVLRHANILPYVPALRFWKKTTDAVDWAHYSSLRAAQGSYVTDADGASATLILPTGKRLIAETPKGPETGDPAESYVFKKFYRGLMEEYQPSTYGADGPDIGTGTQVVQEPGYPIGDPSRTMELYRGKPLSLRYLAITDEQSRAARMQAVVQDYARQLQRLDVIEAVVGVFGRDDGFTEIGEALDVSPFQLYYTTEIGTALRIAGARVEDIQALYRTGAEAIMSDTIPALQITADTFSMDSEGVETRRRRYDDAFGTEYAHPVARGIVSLALYGEDSPFNFRVPDPEFPDASVGMATVVERYQRTVLERLAAVIRPYEAAARTGGAWNDTAQGVFFAAQDEIARANGITIAEHALSLPFARAFGSKSFVSDADKTTLGELIQAVLSLNRKVADAVKGQLETIRIQTDTSNRVDGHLDFARAATTKVRVSGAHRVPDMPWDALTVPVPQHVGRENAEVSIECVTNDPVFLSQVGELRHSQTLLGAVRKSSDESPPLIEVLHRGSFLRSLGVKRLAYKGHTTASIEGMPGYSRIVIDLVQDEATLARFETFERIGGILGGTARMAAPLANFVTPVDKTTATTRDLGAYKLLVDTFLDRNVSGLNPPGNGTHRWSFDDYESWRTAVKARGFDPKTLTVTSVACRFRTRTEREREDGDPRVLAVTVNFNDGDRRGVVELNGGIYFSRLSTLAKSVEGTVDEDGVAANRLASHEAETLIRQIERSVAAMMRQLIELALFVGADKLLRPVPEAKNFYQRNALAPYVSPYEAQPEGPNYRGTDNLTDMIGSLFGDDPHFAAASLAAGVRDESQRLVLLAALSNGVRDSMISLLGDADGARLVRQIADTLNDAAAVNPHAYPDLLMPVIRNPVQGANIVGWDFPHGPGGVGLADEYLDDYSFAESLRTVMVLKTAAIGLGVLTDDDATDAPQLSGAYAEILNRVSVDVEAKGRAFPAEIAPDQLAKDLAQFEEQGLLRGNVDGTHRMGRREWVKLYRIAQTVMFTHAVVQIANDSGAFSGEITAVLDAMETDGFLSSTSVGDTAAAADVVTDVQDSVPLARMRKDLVALYSSDEETIAGILSYTDETAEGTRQELLERIRDTWIRPVGMKGAFPSYTLVVTNPVGMPGFDFLADQYVWTAVQSIDVRELDDAPGQSCEVVLSNVRMRSDYSNRDTSSLGEDLGTRVELRVGTHLHVYTGYGADLQHMYPFCGRVVEVQPGPVMRIVASSYAATLNNTPNGGKGLNLNSWQFESTLSELILRAISDTEGLEGLGRAETSGTMDPLGREIRGVVQDEYEASLLFRWVSRAGSAIVGEQAFQSQLQGRSEQAVGEGRINLRRLIEKYGFTELRRIALGSTRLFENVWFVTSPQQYGFSNVVFGGLWKTLSEGKGYGWFAEPDQTTWSILQEMCALFPDYVVAVRPYNVGTPVSRLGMDPLRQTLYFGPADGSYISTSRPYLTGRSLETLTADLLEGLARDADMSLSTTNEDGTPDAAGRTRLLGIYRRLIIAPLRSAILQRAGDNEGGLRGTLTGIWNGTRRILGGDVDSLDNLLTESEVGEAFATLVEFQNTIEAVFRIGRTGQFSRHDPRGGAARGLRVLHALGLYGDQVGVAHSRYAQGYDDANIFTPDVVEVPSGNAEAAAAYDAQVDQILRVFRAELPGAFSTANQRIQQNLGTDTDNGPVLTQIFEQARSMGYTVPESTVFTPLVKHHFAGNYDTLVTNDIMATQDADEFANKVTIIFPSDMDNRSGPFAADPNTSYRYSVQAGPTLSPDFISEKVVVYPNVEFDWLDASNMYTAAFTGTAAAGDAHATRAETALGHARGLGVVEIVGREADRQGLPKAFLAAIITRESDFNYEGVVVPRQNNGSDIVSIAQISKQNHPDYDGTRPGDHEAAIVYAAGYLKENFDRFDGDLKKVAIAYNRGPGFVNGGLRAGLSTTEIDTNYTHTWTRRNGTRGSLGPGTDKHEDGLHYGAGVLALTRAISEVWYSETADTATGDTDQLSGADRLKEFQDLVKTAQEKQQEGEDATDELARISEMQAAFRTSIEQKPKFQTVATNLLRDHMRHMYDGLVVMRGTPSLHTRHVVHIWDDVRRIHGPVEARRVHHHFGLDGFYTRITPGLVCRLRGFDQTMDVAWMNWASKLYNTSSVFRRIGEAFSGGLLLGGRAMGYKFVADWAAKIGGTTGALAVLGRSATPLFFADLAYTAVSGLVQWRIEDITQHVGMLAEMTDANPVLFLPLSEKGRPFTAGLVGLIGPSTISASVADALDDRNRSGSAALGLLEALKASTTQVGVQTGNN